MKRHLLALILATPAFAQDPDRWDLRARVARFEDYQGRRALFLQQGDAYLKDVSFADGTLEVDVAVPKARTFAGVIFRMLSPEDREEVYLRPHKSALEDAIQYQPTINGGSTWQLFNGAGFTAAVDIPKERWFHLKVEFRGWEARVYVDGSDTAALFIRNLQRDYAKGGIGLWGGAAGAWFANLRYEARDEAPPAPKPNVRPPRGVIEKWELSAAFEAEDSLPAAIPAALGAWQSVTAGPTGMLLINRYRKSSGALPPSADVSKRLERGQGRRVVFARTTIESETNQAKRLSFGYSDEIVIFLNGLPLFQGRSAWRFRDETALGIMDVENDAVYLPLNKGRNVLVIAVAEYFGGWGLIARLDDPTMVRLGRSLGGAGQSGSQ